MSHARSSAIECTVASGRSSLQPRRRRARRRRQRTPRRRRFAQARYRASCRRSSASRAARRRPRSIRCSSISRMRLRKAFVGAARRREGVAEPLLRRARARVPRATCRSRSPSRKPAAASSASISRTPGKSAICASRASEVVPIPRREIRVPLGREPRRDVPQRVGEPEADHDTAHRRRPARVPRGRGTPAAANRR